MNMLPTRRLAILFLLLVSLGTGPLLFGQTDTISAISNSDAEALIRDIFLGGGQCFEVFNVELNGQDGQIGTFSNGQASIGFDNGIILSNGSVNNISGPNQGFGFADADVTTSYGVVSSDPDLEILSAMEGDANPNFFDAVVLEFDFTPTLDTISFDFVFASEEYCDFSLTSFVDLFGFFISGPGITGPFTDGGINMAVVPGTTEPITAQNISPFMNASYYLNNIPPGQIGCSLGQPAPDSDFIAFDGFTVPLVASAEVIPCETYHLRMVVADRGFDDQLDAAVFLRANSFAAGLTSRITSEVTGPNAGSDSPYEGCGFTSIIFSRGDTVTSSDLVVHYDLLANSTATPGLDYMALPDSVIIPAGQLTDTIDLAFFADDITEGTEFFTIRLRNPCDCSAAELTINILEPPPVSANIVGPDKVCEGEAFSLAAVPIGGIGEISYEWSNGDMDSLLNFVPAITDTYELIISDECGSIDTLLQEVRVQAPEGAISGDIIICDGRPAEDIAVVLTDGDVFEFELFENGNPTTFSNIAADTLYIPVNGPGTYQIGNLNADGCPGNTNGQVQVDEIVVSTMVAIDSINCFGDADASITLTPNGGAGGYTYEWQHDGAITTNAASGLDIGNYDIVVSDTDGCVDSIAVLIDQPQLLELSLDTISAIADCMVAGSLQGQPNGGVPPYSFNWSDGTTTALNQNMPAGDYTLTINDDNGCLTMIASTVVADSLLPIISLQATDTLDCITNNVDIDAAGSSQMGNYTYAWTSPDGSALSPPDPMLVNTTTPGVYILSITDNDNGCVQTDSLEIIEINDGLVVSIGGDADLSCAQPSGQLFFPDSLAGLEASWQLLDGTPIASNANNISISGPGDYVLMVVQSATGCMGADTITVTANENAPVLSLVGTPDSLDCTTNQVAIDIDVSSGPGNYSYEWQGPPGGINGSSTMQDVLAIEPGVYQVFAENFDNGCRDTLAYEVIQDLSDLAIDPIPDTTLSCAVPQIALTASSPDPGNIGYEWFDSQGASLGQDATLQISAADTYTVQLTNLDNGCFATTMVDVGADTIRPQVTALLPDELNCLNDSTTLTVQPGPDFYSFRWRNAMGEALSSTSQSQTVGDGGGYILTVTDDRNGCRSSVLFEVLIDTIAPEITLELPDTLTCLVQDVILGPATVTGSGNYDYNWSGPNNGIVGPVDIEQANAQEPGIYMLEVVDADNGCIDQEQLTVEVDRLAPELTALSDTTLNCYEPEALVEGSSTSTGMLSYEWFDEAGVSISSLPELLLTTEGTYRLVLTNTENGCTDEEMLSVDSDFDSPAAEAGADALITCSNTTATLTGDIGESTWVPSWLDASGNILSSGSWSYETQQLGTYTLEVLDSENGCTATDVASVDVDQSFPSAIVATQHSIDCFLGSAFIDGSGSSQGNEFNYQILDDNGNVIAQSSEPSFNINAPGQYEFVVIDTDNACSQSAPFAVSLEEPSIVALDIADIPCGDTEGSITFSDVQNGTMPYLYSIDNGSTFTTSPIFSNLQEGQYDLVVEDANGCQASSNATITAATGVNVSLPEQVELELLENYTLNPVIGNVALNDLVEIKWSGSNQLSCLDCLNPEFIAEETTFLTLSLTDVNGCSASATILLIVDERVPVFIPNAFSPDGLDGANDFFTVFGDPSKIVEVLQMNIFDRWGGLVFSRNNLPINAPSEGWDGKANGTTVNPGVYVYWIEVQLANGQIKIMEGDVVLLK